MVLPVLSTEEQRVLGCLLEKQVTVPDTYPLTLNALRTACNQSSSRDPVVDWDEPTVEALARGLRQRELVRVVWADKGRRVLKYHQLLTEQVELARDERALLTVLLLRGEQAPGELRSRTERLHAFADRTDTEACLSRMAERALVAELAKRPGERDARWTHLLGTTEAPPAPVEVPDDRDDEVRRTYTAVAQPYADAFTGELAGMPFERWVLDQVERGPVVDVGCGPGHVTAHLAARGLEATGVDLTPAMVDQARERHPDGTYEVGDLRQLMRPSGATGWSAVLAWYSLVHLSPAELPGAVAALVRPLAPGGQLVLAMQTGDGSRRITDWHGEQVGITLVQHDRNAVLEAVRSAGLTDVRWYVRGPVGDEQSERLYVLARQP